jgi:hypothetical protein
MLQAANTAVAAWGVWATCCAPGNSSGQQLQPWLLLLLETASCRAAAGFNTGAAARVGIQPPCSSYLPPI